MSYRKIALLALAFVMTLPLAALAGPGPGGRGPGGFEGPGFGGAGCPGCDGPGFGGPGFGRHARHLFPPPGYLDLTDEQKEAVDALRESVRTRLDGVREEGRALREKLRTALEGDAPDATEVGQTVIDLHAHRGEVRAVFEDAERQFAALLTEEQLEKWENFKELRGHRRGPRHRDRDRVRGGFGEGPGQI